MSENAHIEPNTAIAPPLEVNPPIESFPVNPEASSSSGANNVTPEDNRAAENEATQEDISGGEDRTDNRSTHQAAVELSVYQNYMLLQKRYQGRNKELLVKKEINEFINLNKEKIIEIKVGQDIDDETIETFFDTVKAIATDKVIKDYLTWAWLAITDEAPDTFFEGWTSFSRILRFLDILVDRRARVCLDGKRHAIFEGLDGIYQCEGFSPLLDEAAVKQKFTIAFLNHIDNIFYNSARSVEDMVSTFATWLENVEEGYAFISDKKEQDKIFNAVEAGFTINGKSYSLGELKIDASALKMDLFNKFPASLQYVRHTNSLLQYIERNSADAAENAVVAKALVQVNDVAADNPWQSNKDRFVKHLENLKNITLDFFVNKTLDSFQKFSSKFNDGLLRNVIREILFRQKKTLHGSGSGRFPGVYAVLAFLESIKAKQDKIDFINTLVNDISFDQDYFFNQNKEFIILVYKQIRDFNLLVEWLGHVKLSKVVDGNDSKENNKVNRQLMELLCSTVIGYKDDSQSQDILISIILNNNYRKHFEDYIKTTPGRLQVLLNSLNDPQKAIMFCGKLLTSDLTGELLAEELAAILSCSPAEDQEKFIDHIFPEYLDGMYSPAISVRILNTLFPCAKKNPKIISTLFSQVDISQKEHFFIKAMAFVKQEPEFSAILLEKYLSWATVTAKKDAKVLFANHASQLKMLNHCFDSQGSVEYYLADINRCKQLIKLINDKRVIKGLVDIWSQYRKLSDELLFALAEKLSHGKNVKKKNAEIAALLAPVLLEPNEKNNVYSMFNTAKYINYSKSFEQWEKSTVHIKKIVYALQAFDALSNDDNDQEQAITDKRVLKLLTKLGNAKTALAYLYLLHTHLAGQPAYKNEFATLVKFLITHRVNPNKSYIGNNSVAVLMIEKDENVFINALPRNIYAKAFPLTRNFREHEEAIEQHTRDYRVGLGFMCLFIVLVPMALAAIIASVASISTLLPMVICGAMGIVTSALLLRAQLRKGGPCEQEYIYSDVVVPQYGAQQPTFAETDLSNDPELTDFFNAKHGAYDTHKRSADKIEKMLSPSAKMGKWFLESFQPYSLSALVKNILQPVYGVLHVTDGIIDSIVAPFSLFKYKKTVKSVTVNLLAALGNIALGVFEIITTPLLLIKIPMRVGISLCSSLQERRVVPILNEALKSIDQIKADENSAQVSLQQPEPESPPSMACVPLDKGKRPADEQSDIQEAPHEIEMVPLLSFSAPVEEPIPSANEEELQNKKTQVQARVYRHVSRMHEKYTKHQHFFAPAEVSDAISAAFTELTQSYEQTIMASPGFVEKAEAYCNMHRVRV